MTIKPTRRRLTVPLRRCTAAPNGRITTAATRSLEIAFDGVTLNSRISIGVISAPPPAPVIPTRKPMMALPRTMYGSTCIVESSAAKSLQPALGELSQPPRRDPLVFRRERIQWLAARAEEREPLL